MREKTIILAFFGRHKAAILGTLLLLLGFVAVMRFLMARESVLPQTETKIHYYGNPSVPVDHIRINAFYVVPRGAQAAEEWEKELGASLGRINKFHQLQFLGRSSIVFNVYPNPVFLDMAYREGDFKDEASSVNAIMESFKRSMRESSDGFLEKIGGTPSDYAVTLFLFEGPLSAAGGRSLIFSRRIFADSIRQGYADSLLYHYFARTLGIPNLYDETNNTSVSEGVMGLGKFRTLQLNYIGDSITKKMGLLN